MKYLNRELRGTKGYIKKQRLFELIKTLVMFAMALGIFFIGLFTLGTKKSLWSVFAVLALLPACRALVGFIMFARFSSLSDDEYRRYDKRCENLPVIYENILTTSDRTFFVPVICAVGGNVLALYLKDKDEDHALRDHINAVCKTAGHDVTVKIFDDETAFFTRIDGARANLTVKEGKDKAAIDAIRSVSL